MKYLVAALFALFFAENTLYSFTYTRTTVPPVGVVTNADASGRVNPAPQQTLSYIPSVPVVSATDDWQNGMGQLFSFSLVPDGGGTATFSFTLNGQTLTLPNVALGNQLVVSANTLGNGNECVFGLRNIQIGADSAAPGVLFANALGTNADYQSFVFTGFNVTDAISGSGDVSMIWLSSTPPAAGIAFDIASTTSIVPEPGSTAWLLGGIFGLASLLLKARSSRVLQLLARGTSTACDGASAASSRQSP